MERTEFLNSLFAMYGRSFTETNKQEWLKAYKKVLSEKIDFDALYDSMLYDYDSKTAPSPAWLSKKARVKQGMETAPKSIETVNIMATAPNGIEYQFAYIPSESNFALESENLIKSGFTNVRRI